MMRSVYTFAEDDLLLKYKYMPVIELEIAINADRTTCFDLSRSIDLHTFSTAGTKERAIAGRTTGLIGAGETVTWQATHFGIRQKLTSAITACDRPFHFRDEQVKGAFKCIRHDHFFRAENGGTLMKDVFYFQSPLGVLGRLVDAVIMKRYLTGFLTERNRIIKKFAESGEGIALLQATAPLNITGRSGIFSYTDNGFILHRKHLKMYYLWADIESVFAYKADWVTTDEICLNLFAKNGLCIQLGESDPGWELFLQHLRNQFPSISVDWEAQIIQPPFETNFTLLFERKGHTTV